MGLVSSDEIAQIHRSSQGSFCGAAGIGTVIKSPFPVVDHMVVNKMMENSVQHVRGDNLTRFGIGDDKNRGRTRLVFSLDNFSRKSGDPCLVVEMKRRMANMSFVT